MKETLPRVLDHALDGAVIISLFNGAIVYANHRATKILPNCAPDLSIEMAIKKYATRREVPSIVEPSVATQLAQGAPLVVEHLVDVWMVGSPMVKVDGYPPCGIITICAGPDHEDDERRRTALASHMQLSFGARAALELDQARRDLHTMNSVLNQILFRVNDLGEALISNSAEFPMIGLSEETIYARPRAS